MSCDESGFLSDDMEADSKYFLSFKNYSIDIGYILHTILVGRVFNVVSDNDIVIFGSFRQKLIYKKLLNF